MLRQRAPFTGGDGEHYRIDQLAHQTRRERRIVKKRFCYGTVTIAAA